MSVEVGIALGAVKGNWRRFPRKPVAGLAALLVLLLVAVFVIGLFRGPAFLVTGKATQLMPGVPGQLVLVLTNPHGYSVRVTSLQVVVADASRDCVKTNLTVSRFNGTVVLLPHSVMTSSLEIELSIQAPGSCRSAEFPLTYTGTAGRP